jgi:hypothetical protein
MFPRGMYPLAGYRVPKLTTVPDRTRAAYRRRKEITEMFPFMKLSRELRDKIYEFAIEPRKIFTLRHDDSQLRNYENQLRFFPGSNAPVPTALLLVSKTVNAEVKAFVSQQHAKVDRILRPFLEGDKFTNLRSLVILSNDPVSWNSGGTVF